MSLHPENVFGGRYVLVKALGVGGMAAVWQVRHLRLNTLHALKVLHYTGPPAGAPELRARLLEEGRVQARLAHPNIVRVTDVVELPEGAGLIMDLVEGPSLRAHLDSAGRLPLEEALVLGAGILDGVACAHTAGLIHRDIKPANILLEPAGPGWRPRVADFGLARAASGREPGAGPARTRAGVAMGTPGYMAPEQYRDAASVGPPADVFSLGCVLFELLTGHRTFPEGDLIALYQRALRADYADPRALAPDLPPALAGLVVAALSPRSAERPLDAVALALAWRGHAGLPAAPTTAPPITSSTAQLAAPDLGAPSDNHTFTTATLTLPEEALRSPNNLPPRQDAFFGREHDLARLQQRLAEPAGDTAALVTLLGTGGLGKTRLALELAHRRLGDFPGGAWFCDLSEARSQEGLCFAVSRALGVPLGRAEPLETLGNAIAARADGGPALLILDNAEQLREVAAGALSRWRRRAPGVAFLITSRAVLGLPGERLLPIEPLSTGDAARLFEERARARRPSFALDAGNIAAVEALVEQLDGLPLAIELAAARAGALSPEAIAARLGQRFRLLASRQQDTSARQATLRGAIDWSWDLLGDWEKGVFAQCSVFEGGFTLEAAEAVLDLAEEGDDIWPMDAVQALLDKSLLRAQAGRDGQQRYSMFISLRQYADEKLSGEARARCQRRHADYYAGFGRREALDSLERPGGVARWWALCDDLDNLVAASRSALAAGALLTGALAAQAAVQVLHRQGPGSTALALLEDTLARCEGADRPEARRALVDLYISQGDVLAQQGSREAARQRLETALELARALGERRGEAHALSTLGIVLRYLGETDSAVARVQAALELYRQLGERGGEASALALRALLCRDTGEMDESRRLLEASIAIRRALGSRRSEAIDLTNLGILHRDQGRLEQARAQYRAALAITREVGDRANEAIVRGLLGIIDCEQGQLLAGREHMEAALAIHREVGNRPFEGSVRGNLAILSMDLGLTDEARAHYEAALTIHREVENRYGEAITLGNLGTLLMGTGQLEEARASIEASLVINREIKHRRSEAISLSALGQLARLEGRPGESRALLEEALEIHREVGNRQGEGISLGHLALLRLDAGEATEALFADSAALLTAVGDTLSHGRLLAERAAIELARGDLGAAASSLASAEALATEADVPPASSLGLQLKQLRQDLG
jgi:predicted ATPase/serine/threonine protein kinase/Tfp pilus assembly protein PilF